MKNVFFIKKLQETQKQIRIENRVILEAEDILAALWQQNLHPTEGTTRNLKQEQ